jgi:hypothetical protein
VRSLEGHVVVRLETDGGYQTLVTDKRDEEDTVKFVSEKRMSP